MVGYWIVGAVVMLLVEKWNFLHSTYFAVATMLAIGYGDFYPTLPSTKLFTALYVFVGITLTTTAAAINLTQDLAWMYEDYCDDVEDEQDVWRAKRLRRAKAQQQGGATALAETLAREADERRTETEAERTRGCCHGWDWCGVTWSLCSVGIFLATGTIFLTLVEGGKFNALNSFYFTAVTMGHVGYGDITPQKPISLAFLVIFILCTWGGYTVIMGKVINIFLKQEHQWQLRDNRVMVESTVEERIKHHLFFDLSEDELLAQRKAFRSQVHVAIERRQETSMDVDDADNPESTPTPYRESSGRDGRGRRRAPAGLDARGDARACEGGRLVSTAGGAGGGGAKKKKGRRSLFGIFG